MFYKLQKIKDTMLQIAAQYMKKHLFETQSITCTFPTEPLQSSIHLTLK